jgi:hypothetical protein
LVGLSLPPKIGETAMDILVEGFNVFGVHVQYWMLLTVLAIAVAITISSRWDGWI